MGFKSLAVYKKGTVIVKISFLMPNTHLINKKSFKNKQIIHVYSKK